MISFLMVRPGRFYRVEVSDNLFGEYTVVREWGAGRHVTRLMRCFSNLRDACVAAEKWARRVRSRGYHTSMRLP